MHWDYTLALNAGFLFMSAGFLWWRWKGDGLPRSAGGWVERVLFVLACTALAWLAGGLLVG